MPTDPPVLHTTDAASLQDRSGPNPCGSRVLLYGTPAWAEAVATTLREVHDLTVTTVDVATELSVPRDVDCVVTDDPAVLRDWDDGRSRGAILHGHPEGDLDALLAPDHTDVVPRSDADDDLALLAARIESHVERHRLARSLRLREAALDQAGVGITMADATTQGVPMTYLNDGFTALTGYEPAEILGDNCNVLQGEGTDPETVDRIRQALADEEPVSVDIRNYRKDGTPFWNQLDITPIADEDGVVTNYFGFQKDVTERKRLERDLKRKNDRLEEFAGVLSHDIRNPVSVALGNVEAARDLVEDANAADQLEDAAAALDRVDALVAEVLTFARNGATVEDPERVLVSEVAREAWRTSDTGDVEVEVRGDADAISADPDRLRTLFENLFRNAADHGESATRIVVETTEGGFVVSDDGRGIPPDEREAVFERGHTTDAEGTGFGLAIVEAIAEAHGWSVSLGESEDGGAAFHFSGVESA